jgi:hypothetical protein
MIALVLLVLMLVGHGQAQIPSPPPHPITPPAPSPPSQCSSSGEQFVGGVTSAVGKFYSKGAVNTTPTQACTLLENTSKKIAGATVSFLSKHTTLRDTLLAPGNFVTTVTDVVKHPLDTSKSVGNAFAAFGDVFNSAPEATPEQIAAFKASVPASVSRNLPGGHNSLTTLTPEQTHAALTKLLAASTPAQVQAGAQTVQNQLARFGIHV